MCFVQRVYEPVYNAGSEVSVTISVLKKMDFTSFNNDRLALKFSVSNNLQIR
jgi:hypothetical protein